MILFVTTVFVITGLLLLYKAFESFKTDNFAVFAAYTATYHTMSWLWTLEAVPFYRASVFIEYLLVTAFLCIIFGYIYFLSKYFAIAIFKLKGVTVHKRYSAVVYLTLLQPLIVLSYSILLAGHGSNSGLGFLFTSSGTPLSLTPLVSLAWPLGFFSLSFITYTLFELFDNKKYIIIGYICAVGVLFYYLPMQKEIPKIKLVSTQFSDYNMLHNTDELKKRRGEYSRLIGSTTEKVLIVLPEDSRFLPLNVATSSVRDTFVERNRTSWLLDGSTFLNSDDKRITTSILFSPELKNVERRTKERPFPYSEYSPYIISALTSFVNSKEPVAATYGSGSKPLKMEGFMFDSVLCGETLSVPIFFDVLLSKSDAVISQSNLDFLHHGYFSLMMYSSVLKTLASGTHKPLIASTNNGASVVLTSFGREIFRVENGSAIYDANMLIK